MSGMASWRDRIVDAPRVAQAVGAVVLWVGLSALFGEIGRTDWLVAGALLVAGTLRPKVKPKDSTPGSIYGPPQ
jgi:hypothetical protein